MIEHFKNLEKTQEVLQEAKIGLWVIELDEGKEPRMYADHAMLELLGSDQDIEPEECYRLWYDRIDKDYYSIVQAAVDKLILDEQAEVQYPWNHPEWGWIFVRCGGVRDFSYTQGICLRGYHQNITNTVVMKQEYDTIIQTLEESYLGVVMCNVSDGSFRVKKSPERIAEKAAQFSDYQEMFLHYVENEVDISYRERFAYVVDRQKLKGYLDSGEKAITVLYRNVQGGWRRARIVKSELYCEDYPWIIIAFDEQDLEMAAQKREHALSKLCQCYYSIYLFDLENNIEEPIWQEELIKSRREFPVGNLQTYYDKFVENYVALEDQSKMKRAATPEFLQQVLTLEQPVYDVDFRRIYPDSIEWVRSRFSIAEMKNGKVTKVVFANMNIHDQKMAELEEEQQKKNALLSAYETAQNANEAKSNFLARMSHDIRTPLNGILGMSSIAKAHMNDKDKIKDCLEKIDYSSRHLLELINEILDMSKIEKGKIELNDEIFHLEGLIDEINSITRAGAMKKGLDIQFNCKDLVHDRLKGDAGRIRQVLINLISNAVKYTKTGGKVQVTVQEVAVSTPGEGCFVFTVEDNGIGISEEFLDYIFVPFLRENDIEVQNTQGTGLGMSIAQGIVSAMQGNIQVESQKGKGSKFIVTLHLKIMETAEGTDDKSALGELNEPNEQQKRLLCGKRILIVEDNELNKEIVCTMLETYGMICSTASNGQEAVDVFRNAPPHTYHAILMDIQMPVMDGFTATRTIRRSNCPDASSIPVIALTANAFAEDIAKALAAGMNDHVAKPIDYKRLLEVLIRFLIT